MERRKKEKTRKKKRKRKKIVSPLALLKESFTHLHFQAVQNVYIAGGVIFASAILEGEKLNYDGLVMGDVIDICDIVQRVYGLGCTFCEASLVRNNT